MKVSAKIEVYEMYARKDDKYEEHIKSELLGGLSKEISKLVEIKSERRRETPMPQDDRIVFSADIHVYTEAEVKAMLRLIQDADAKTVGLIPELKTLYNKITAI